MTRFPRLLAVLLAALAAAGCGSVYVVPEDVTGTVVDMTRAPLSGMQVLVGDTLTTTDEAGHFTVPRVTPPYDLAIAYVDFFSRAPAGHVYLGMTDPAPTVVAGLYGPGSAPQRSSARLNVVLPAANTSTVVGWVVVEGTDNLAWVSDPSVNSTPGGPVRSMTVEWAPAPSTAIRIHALQVQLDPATLAPLHYVGYDTTDLVLDDQGDTTWSASYGPPPFSESPLSFTLSAPAGYTAGTAMLGMRLPGSTAEWPVANSLAGGPVRSFVVPDLATAVFSIGVLAGDDEGASDATLRGLTAGTTGLALQLDPHPTMTSPPEGATFGVGSTVTWMPGGSGAAYTTLVPAPNATGPSVHLWGGDGSATVPDLSVLGFQLPHHAKYTLGVLRTSSAQTVEDFASRSYAPALPGKPLTGASMFRDVKTP